jgi:uncharacterized repeat protein (TIGR03803 family)
MGRKPLYAALIAVTLAACGGSSGSGVLPSPSPFSGNAVSIVYGFTPSEGQSIKPEAPLLYHNGVLYGTTAFTWTKDDLECCGTVFSVTTGGDYKVVHRFNGRDGHRPRAGLIWYNGRLWGTAPNGGGGCGITRGCGVIFAVDPTTGKEVENYFFKGGASDGAFPYGALVEYGGMLYGTTVNAGTGSCGTLGCGTIFQLDPRSGAEKIVHNFNGKDGAYPYAGLTVFKGKLYGTTAKGGDACAGLGCGTIFDYDPATKHFSVAFRFNGDTGDNPRSGLTLFTTHSGFHYLLGTTVDGGSHRAGTLYAFPPEHPSAVRRFELAGGDAGRYPYGDLLPYQGWVYGTTSGSAFHAFGCGHLGCGVVFKWNVAEPGLHILHVFKGAPNDGQTPLAGFVAVGGTLYSTTELGGSDRCNNSKGCGAVFSITP